MLAIFETKTGTKFALHCEVKQPKDEFPKNKDQAANYKERALCWVNNPPAKVLLHENASTILICSDKRLIDYTVHAEKFGSVITFEKIANNYPDIGKKMGSHV